MVPWHRPIVADATAPPDPPGLLLDLWMPLHSVGILLLSAHFRKIVRGIDKMINGDGEKKPQDPAGRRASTSRFSLTGESSSSKVPWDIVFMVAIVTLILLGSITAVLLGLFSLGDVFTLLVTAAWCIILVSLGVWFRYYANKVISMMKGSTGMSKGMMDRIDRLSSNARQHVRRRWLSTSERERQRHWPPSYSPGCPGRPPPNIVADSTTFGHPGPPRRYVPDGLGCYRRPPRRCAQPPSRGRWLGLLGWHDATVALLLRHRLLLHALPDEGLPGAVGQGGGPAEVYKGESQRKDRGTERQLVRHLADE